MSAPRSFAEFTTPLNGPRRAYNNTSHARYAQVQSHLEGTHPHVLVGQIWEDIDPRRGGRHVLVNKVNDDGTTSVTTVFVGQGSSKNLGRTTRIATHRFRTIDSNRGYRLRSVLVQLDDAGVPLNLDAVPKAKPINGMVEITPLPKKSAVKTTTPKATPKTPAAKEKGATAAAEVTPAAKSGDTKDKSAKPGTEVTVFKPPTSPGSANPHKGSEDRDNDGLNNALMSVGKRHVSGSDASRLDQVITMRTTEAGIAVARSLTGKATGTVKPIDALIGTRLVETFDSTDISRLEQNIRPETYNSLIKSVPSSPVLDQRINQAIEMLERFMTPSTSVKQMEPAVL